MLKNIKLSTQTRFKLINTSIFYNYWVSFEEKIRIMFKKNSTLDRLNPGLTQTPMMNTYVNLASKPSFINTNPMDSACIVG